MSRRTPMPCLFLIGRAIIRRQEPSWALHDATFVNRTELPFNKLANNKFFVVVYLKGLKTFQLLLLLLKSYYDQKSLYLFFLYLERMYYKYLPRQIVSHDFDEKSDFLNYEFSIRLPDVTSSNQDIKTNMATLVCGRGV